MSSKRTAFVVLMHQHPEGGPGWCATVMCTEGPMAVLATRPWAGAVAEAGRELTHMCKFLPPQEVDIYRIETTVDTASRLVIKGAAWIVANLPQVKHEASGFSHRVHTIR